MTFSAEILSGYQAQFNDTLNEHFCFPISYRYNNIHDTQDNCVFYVTFPVAPIFRLAHLRWLVS